MIRYIKDNSVAHPSTNDEPVRHSVKVKRSATKHKIKINNIDDYEYNVRYNKSTKTHLILGEDNYHIQEERDEVPINHTNHTVWRDIKLYNHTDIHPLTAVFRDNIRVPLTMGPELCRPRNYSAQNVSVTGKISRGIICEITTRMSASNFNQLKHFVSTTTKSESYRPMWADIKEKILNRMCEDTPNPNINEIAMVTLVYTYVISPNTFIGTDHVYSEDLDIAFSKTDILGALDHPLSGKDFVTDIYSKFIASDVSLSCTLDIIDNNDTVKEVKYVNICGVTTQIKTRKDARFEDGLYLINKHSSEETANVKIHRPLDELSTYSIYNSMEEAKSNGDLKLLDNADERKHAETIANLTLAINKDKRKREKDKRKQEKKGIKNKHKYEGYKRKQEKKEIKYKRKYEKYKRKQEKKALIAKRAYEERERKDRIKLNKLKNLTEYLKYGLGVVTIGFSIYTYLHKESPE